MRVILLGIIILLNSMYVYFNSTIFWVLMLVLGVFDDFFIVLHVLIDGYYEFGVFDGLIWLIELFDLVFDYKIVFFLVFLVF